MVTDFKTQEANLKLKIEKNNEKDEQSTDKPWDDIPQSNIHVCKHSEGRTREMNKQTKKYLNNVQKFFKSDENYKPTDSQRLIRKPN